MKYVIKDMLVAIGLVASCYIFYKTFYVDYDSVVKNARTPNDYVLENYADMMGPSLEEAVVGTGDSLDRAIE